MREKFSVPKTYSKRQAERDISEGIEECSWTPKSKEGIHPELIEDFEVENAEQPLSRKELEQEAGEYFDRNFRELVPVLISWDSYRGIDFDVFIRTFGLTNEQMGLLGLAYFIREDESGKKKIYRTDENDPDGVEVHSYEIERADLLVLAWAKEGLRIDTHGEVKRSDSGLPHRYFLRSKNRYLSANDFGMRSYDEETNVANAPDISNVAPFVRTMKQQFVRISENLSAHYNDRFADRFIARKNALLQEGLDANGYTAEGGNNLENRDLVEMTAIDSALKETREAMLDELAANARDRELLSTGITSSKVLRKLYFKSEAIARKYGLLTEDPMKDYASYGRLSARLERLFEEPSESERAGATIEYVESKLFDKPILFGNIDKEEIVRKVQADVREVLGYRAAKGDPETSEIIDQYRCRRGEGSPYRYSTAELYDFIKAIGIEKAQAVLAVDDRDVFRQIKGWELYKKMGFDVARMEPDKLKKQLFEAHKLQEKGLWGYLANREDERINVARARLGKRAEGKSWEEVLGVRATRNLFFEGKRMYWLAQQVFMKNPNRTESDRFYHQYTHWDRYDLSQADVPEEKLRKYLDSHNNFIVALLGEAERGTNQNGETQGTQATLGLIVQALDRGEDLRGVALAYDKQRYLKTVIEGYQGDDITLALADWPPELRGVVAQEEVDMYYEYADDYVLRDPNGLVRYATWRATNEGREWDKIFAETLESKGDLDFRLCLAAQTLEIRGWYKDAAEYAGGKVVQGYLSRFNTTRGSDGSFADWHDVLFWVPNIRKLEVGEARAVIASIQTMDDNKEFINFLPRYDRERDRFREQGAVQSLRELKKRVFAIESNIDLSGLSPEILDITCAPGFNLAKLERLRRRADFHDLTEGKLDKEQPFKPHTRIFAGRPLTDALREGLGSFRQKIRGTAKDQKGLFHALRELVKGRMVGERQIEVTDLLSNIPIDLEEDIIRILQEQQVDVGPTVEAQVHAKSDPEGWVCGNYTDCCMPFGDEKNDDYMFNPSTQYFTIKYNGRIIAQSVVVDARDERKENGNEVVILDNIEIANNYKHLSPLIANVYQTFWAEYTSRPVKVGTGYSDLIPPGGKLETNHYRPRTIIRYSDATGHQIYDLPKIRGVESLDEVVTYANLTEHDAEFIAKLEATIYPEGMAQGKAHIADILRKQRELEVPGAASSFVIRQGDEAAGYLLILPEESEIRPGERVAHVYDMAISPKFQGKGLARKMMERILDIATAYEVPIEAEARASTSYAMLMNDRVRQWFESRGFILTHNEKKEHYLDGEDFYMVRFEYRGVPVE